MANQPALTTCEQARASHFMAQALVEARAALSNGETPVGCVFVETDTGEDERGGECGVCCGASCAR